MARRIAYAVFALTAVLAALWMFEREPTLPPDTAPRSQQELLADPLPPGEPLPSTARADAPDESSDAATGGPRGTLTGRVVDQLGNPLEHCEVTVEELPDTIRLVPAAVSGPSAARTHTRGDGTFRLQHAAGEPLVVTLAHRDFPPIIARNELVLTAERPTDLGDLTLHSRAGLVVHVFDGTSRQPVPQARLELRPQLDDPSLPGHSLELSRRWAISDSGGRGVLYGVPLGAYVLRIEAAGYATFEATLERTAETQAAQRDVALLPGHLLRGRVLTPDGQGDAGALVTARPKTGGPWSAARCGSDGAFRLGGLSAGGHVVDVESQRFGALTLAHVEVRPEGEPLDIQLAPGAVLEGTVVEAANGHAVRGATVRVVLGDGQPLLRGGRILRPSTTTDSRGRFALAGLPRTPLRVQVVAAGLAPGEAGPIEPGEACEVRLLPACRVSGRVLTPDGLPLADAAVRLVDSGYDGSAFAAVLATAVATACEPLEARADRTGRFALTGMPPGLFQLLIRHPLHAPMRVAIQRLQPGTALDLGDMRLRAGGRIHGTVRDHDGAPLAGAAVHLDPIPGSEGIAASSRADATGAFELRCVAVGRYSLYAAVGNGLSPIGRTLITVGPGSDLGRDLAR
jgi:hypothetical protein